MMDEITNPQVHTVVIKSSSQVGKTEILLNAIGFFSQHDPSPMLFIEPTLEMAQAVSKDRVAPMYRDAPGLRAVIGDERANTVLHKRFRGGHLTLAGANSPASLASRPVRVVLLDEVDRYPQSAGLEGNPMTLAKARTKNFWNRKTIVTSTPTIKGASRIDEAFDQSDQRYRHCPCPHCGTFQKLTWKQVKWSEGRSYTAKYFCIDCGAGWTEGERHEAVQKGKWIPEAPFNGVAGFAINELYSPWSDLVIIVQQFLDAKHSRDQESMKAWVNTTLGESYEIAGQFVETEELQERLEDFGPKEPIKVLTKTAGIDVQDDRVECELVGWGEGEESWSLRYDVIHGDPSTLQFWNGDVSRWIADNMPEVTAIDSGGHYTQMVYDFCRRNKARRVYAIKGRAGSYPIWPKKGSKGKKGGRVYIVGVDAAKEVIAARLKLSTPGPGFCHFPKGRDAAYFDGLSSEVCVTVWSKGFPKREWQRRPSSTHNEPWDCRVYAYSAFASLNIRDWSTYKRRKAVVLNADREMAITSPATEGNPAAEESTQAAPPPPPPPVKRRSVFRRSGGFVMGFK